MASTSTHKYLAHFLSYLGVVGIALLLMISVTPPALGSEAACRGIFSPAERGMRTYAEIKELKIMAFNVENLFWSAGKANWTSSSEQKIDSSRRPRPKPEAEIEKIRSIISEEAPDVLIVTEVESREALEHVAQNALKGEYKALLIEGNDARGIDIGFLVRSDLPFLVEEETHKNMMWFDPVDKQQVKLFSRDLPALLLRKSPNEAPFLIVMGNHAKSKRDRPGDPESSIWRKAQYEGIAKIIGDYKQKYKGVPFVLAGDFNSDVNIAPEISPILPLLKSSFQLTENATPLNERFTHTYHPRNGPAEWTQMDDIKVSDELAHSVQEARVYRYRNPDGSIMPFARTLEEREKQPSDHLPVEMRLLTRKLWGENP